ncbi:uncharacterized protein EKO05_0002069 [Ascochyta rabiei]|uniref:EthD domain-containing protein n=1 Tax=Didymella rabiei TaxID=5454 RepID=A0A163C5R5_DIDRA|nr:uncharacterized protein EKO05_0002069 [Ascochyta rabiei]KZM22223.1 hypothetical protein ST47_g6635 [Ascochyta rabiei]UPX11463.1 hypothetical protein EKO05_0002069 [Ascochyta rabiei]
MSAQSTPQLKQIACLRRKSNLTRKEFFDYHFQVHGSLSDTPSSPDEKPHKYTQTHFFDAAFGERPNSVAGTGNHGWTGRDDMTELYFRDWDHLKACFGSEHVRKTIGPDGANFNDLETAIPLMAIEKPLQFKSAVSSSLVSQEGYRTVAVLFLASTSTESEAQLEEVFSPKLIEALQTHAADEVYGLQANVGIPSSQFDIRAYFGGKNMPEYPVTYQIFIKDAGSVAAVRKAQKAFVKALGDQVDESNTFIAFGKEGIILDVGNSVKFDSGRQPQLL